MWRGGGENCLLAKQNLMLYQIRLLLLFHREQSALVVCYLLSLLCSKTKDFYGALEGQCDISVQIFVFVILSYIRNATSGFYFCTDHPSLIIAS